jgi:hypothetical protein
MEGFLNLEQFFINVINTAADSLNSAIEQGKNFWDKVKYTVALATQDTRERAADHQQALEHVLELWKELGQGQRTQSFLRIKFPSYFSDEDINTFHLKLDHFIEHYSSTPEENFSEEEKSEDLPVITNQLLSDSDAYVTPYAPTGAMVYSPDTPASPEPQSPRLSMAKRSLSDAFNNCTDIPATPEDILGTRERQDGDESDQSEEPSPKRCRISSPVF